MGCQLTRWLWTLFFFFLVPPDAARPSNRVSSVRWIEWWPRDDGTCYHFSLFECLWDSAVESLAHNLSAIQSVRHNIMPRIIKFHLCNFAHRRRFSSIAFFCNATRSHFAKTLFAYGFTFFFNALLPSCSAVAGGWLGSAKWMIWMQTLWLAAVSRAQRVHTILEEIHDGRGPEPWTETTDQPTPALLTGPLLLYLIIYQRATWDRIMSSCYINLEWINNY